VNDEKLADEIIARLNMLIEDPAVCRDISRLIERRIPLDELSKNTLNHPTIQIPEGLGVLGILNGLVGVIPDGPRKNWGYISAEFDDDGNLVGFGRTKVGRCRRCGEDNPTRVNGRCQNIPGSVHDWEPPRA
jgi:hypothetical protein